MGSSLTKQTESLIKYPVPQTCHCCLAEETSKHSEAGPLQLSSHGLITTAHPCTAHCRFLKSTDVAQHSKRSLVHFSLPVLVYSPWLQIPSQVEHSKTGMPGTLHWVQHYRHQWLPDRSLFTAEMSAPSSIFGWIQWERNTCALSYVKRRFSVARWNRTEQEVSQGHCSPCTCCRNILKACVLPTFLFLAVSEPLKLTTVLMKNLGKQENLARFDGLKFYFVHCCDATLTQKSQTVDVGFFFNIASMFSQSPNIQKETQTLCMQNLAFG